MGGEMRINSLRITTDIKKIPVIQSRIMGIFVITKKSMGPD